MNSDFFTSTNITAVTSILMVIIWIVYLQLALMQYRRANRPFLIIHHAHEAAPSALCMFVNMSKEPVHIECVRANVLRKGEETIRYVTDYHRITPDDRNVQSRLRQGPIQPGGYLILGAFEDILLGRQSNGEEAQTKSNLSGLKDIEQLTLSIAVVHGPSLTHIGARRSFHIEAEDGGEIIRAQSVYTEQLTSRSKRNQVRRWVEERVNPRRRGAAETTKTPQNRTEYNPEQNKSS
ncbi:MAG: hypothetical protein WD708_06560 [Kiritimatiellia bacterium]